MRDIVIRGSESEVYSEYTDSDRSADEVSAFESSELNLMVMTMKVI